MSGAAPARPRAIARSVLALGALLLGALLLGATACASPKDNPAFHDHDPTSGHAPDFMDLDEFTHPATGDR